MKTLLILLLFLSLTSCDKIFKDRIKTADLKCPRVFFSTENRNYIDSNTSLDDVKIKANLNNFGFNKKCIQKGNTVIIPLDILIVVQPINNLDDSMLNLPVYISLLDKNNNLLETQYFLISGSINLNQEKNNFIETELSDRLEIITTYLETSELIIGFMIEGKKRDLIN